MTSQCVIRLRNVTISKQQYYHLTYVNMSFMGRKIGQIIACRSICTTRFVEWCLIYEINFCCVVSVHKVIALLQKLLCRYAYYVVQRTFNDFLCLCCPLPIQARTIHQLNYIKINCKTNTSNAIRNNDIHTRHITHTWT